MLIKIFVFASQCDTSKTLLGKIKVRCTTVNCPVESVITIYEDGVLQKKYVYYSCKDSGLFLFLSQDKDTLSKSFFIGNRTIGIAKYKYENGNNKSILNYNNIGKKHGLCESWREDGTRKDSTVYKDGNTIEAREYYLNGKPRYWEKYKGEEVIAIETFPDGSTLDNVHNPIIHGFYYDFKTGKILTKVINGNGKAIYFAEDGSNPDTCIIKNGARVRKKQ
jgi:antitoxin component YwqK of YwqJK toxin-antitoxin module